MLHSIKKMRLATSATIVMALFCNSSASAFANPESSNSLKQTLEAAMKADKIPGMTFVVFHKNGIILKGEVGVSRADSKGVQVQADSSLFRIGSVAKLFTSLTTSLLIQDGQLSRDSKLVDLDRTDVVRIIRKYETVARLKQWDKIKIHHLMSHQAGISKDISGSLLGFNTASLQKNSYPTMKTLYNKITSTEFLFEPGQISTRFKYSNLAMNILARVVEAYNPWRLRYSEYVTESLLRPLKMNLTFFDIPVQRQSQMVTGYGSLLPNGSRYEAPQALFAGSYEGSMGVASTATDLSRLGREMLKIVYGESRYLYKQSVVADWLAIKSPGTPTSAYASGPSWNVLPGENINDDLWFGHQGTGASERAALLVNPERNLGIAVLFNTSDANREKYIQLILKQLKVDRPDLFAQKVQLSQLPAYIVANARRVMSATTPVQNMTPPPYPANLDVKKYVGNYFADLAGVLPITYDATTGHLVFMGQKLVYEGHLGAGRFRMPDVPAPATNTNREPIVFKFDAQGKVVYFKAFNIAIFKRVN